MHVLNLFEYCGFTNVLAPDSLSNLNTSSKGTDNEYGMCPARKPGRGSDVNPLKRSVLRASNTGTPEKTSYVCC